MFIEPDHFASLALIWRKVALNDCLSTGYVSCPNALTRRYLTSETSWPARPVWPSCRQEDVDVCVKEPEHDREEEINTATDQIVSLSDCKDGLIPAEVTDLKRIHIYVSLP